MASTRFYRSSALVRLGTANITSGGRVLLLADEDGASTTALANSVASAGFLVTVRPAPEYTWDGTNPSLDRYDVVIHLNGNTFGEGQALSATAQSALVDFVRGGGGYIGAQWNSYEATGTQASMPDLVLAGFPGSVEENCASCPITYSILPGQEAHPLVAGLPSEFTFEADGHMGGPQVEFGTEPSTVIMQLPSGTPGVLAQEPGFGQGGQLQLRAKLQSGRRRPYAAGRQRPAALCERRAVGAGWINPDAYEVARHHYA